MGTFSSSPGSHSHISSVDHFNLSENKLDENCKFLTTLNANARSLGPKVDSLADCIFELNADIAIVTETWLQDRAIVNATLDMAGEHGLDLFTLNRQNIAANGRQYGGVAIACR